MKRARYQQGSLTIRKRKKGAVWAFRWWETRSDGQRVQREKIVGSLVEFPTRGAACRAIESERVAINAFKGPDDWVFASARRAGKQPCWPDSLLRKRVRPAAERAGITVPIGWHTFRRSFSSWLKSGGADMKVVQELMRHANLRTTMELYTQAPMGAKREAQRKIAEQIALATA